MIRNALGPRSHLQRWLRRALLVAPAALAIAACDRPKFTFSDSVPVASGGFVGVGGSFGTAGIAGTTPTDPCAFNRITGSAAVFSGQTVTNRLPARPFLYTEVSDAEATALRKGGSLLPPAPSPGTSGNQTLTDVLSQALASSANSQWTLLNAIDARFKSTRAVWPNAWALRLVDHPGTEHMNPVLVTFKKTALFVSLADHNVTVVDINNAVVSTDVAASAPERVAAVFYIYNDGTSFGASCDDGKREMALGNEAMVEQISLGTKEILTRLDSDIDALNAFFNIARPCGKVDTQSMSFRAFTVCTTWDFFNNTPSELEAYQWSLSTPAELYKPTAQNLASLIQALKDDRFDVDPYTGAPPAPQVGGAGGAGGAGGEAGLGGAP